MISPSSVFLVWTWTIPGWTLILNVRMHVQSELMYRLACVCIYACRYVVRRVRKKTFMPHNAWGMSPSKVLPMCTMYTRMYRCNRLHLEHILKVRIGQMKVRRDDVWRVKPLLSFFMDTGVPGGVAWGVELGELWAECEAEEELEQSAWMTDCDGRLHVVRRSSNCLFSPLSSFRPTATLCRKPI